MEPIHQRALQGKRLTPLLVQMLLAMQVGCAPTLPQAGLTAPVRRVDPTAVKFGEDADRRFNFGHVIGDPRRKLSHTFTFQNQTGKMVRIARVVNGMPCCGEVEPLQANEVRPGDALSVTVRVRPQRIGPMHHWATIITDGPDAGEILLDTLAQVHAPLRIAALDENAPDVAPSHDVTRRFELIECLSISERTKSQETAGWSITVPERTAKVQWEGAPHARPFSNELEERIHPFSVTLTAGEQSGADGTSLVISDGKEPRLTYQFRWNVAVAIKASPTLLRFRSQSPETHALILSCIDSRPFKILGLTCNLPGVVVSTREASGARHVLDVTFKAGAFAGRTRLGEIAIETNLAAQKRVKVPVLFINETVKP